MLQRGRKSSAALAVIDRNGALESIGRVPPPADLTHEQRLVWMRTVNAKPAEWFDDSHLPLLAQYCRHVATADMLTAQINTFQAEWLMRDDGVQRLKRLCSIRATETQWIATLARHMRLTHQSQYRADKAAVVSATSKGGRKPWQSDVE